MAIIKIIKKGKCNMIKNLTLSLIAIVVLSSSAIAETYPAYGPDSYKALHDSDTTDTSEYKTQNTGGYIGIGYSYVTTSVEGSTNQRDIAVEVNNNGLSILGGYIFNENFAIEGRFTTWEYDLYPGGDIFDIPNIALYLKPMYPIASNVNVYGLIGFGHFLDDYADDGLQWGIGGEFAINNDLYLFVDYTRLISDSETISQSGYTFDVDATLDAFTFGIKHHF